MSTLLQEQPLTSCTRPSRVSLPYQVQVIRTLAEFETVRHEWDQFLKTCGIQNLCLTHGWLSIWLRHFQPKELRVVIVQDADGQWIAVAPLQIKPSRNGLTHRLLRAVEWIGTNPSVFDCMEFPVHAQANETAVFTAIANSLRHAQWDVLELKYCLNEEQLQQLVTALRMGSPKSIARNGAIPYLPLPATLAEYEPTKRKKTRLEVNRHKNRFVKEYGIPVRLEFQSVGEAANATMTRFFEGHIKYWAERGQKSDFQRFPALTHFYKDMLAYSQTDCQPEDPQLLLSTLMVGDQQLSYHLGFWQGSGYLSHITNYNAGFKSYSPGTIHMDELVYATLHRGGQEFEFGRGEEPYKKLWTQTKKPLWQLRIFRNPLSAALWEVDIILKKLLKKGHE